MASVTKRGSKWYAMWRGADGRLVQKVTQAHAKAEAVLYAQDKERQAWRQREGLEPDPGEAMTFGELLDWWWDRYGSQRRGYSNDKFLPFLEKHLGELRDQELKPGTAGHFADRLDQLLTRKEQDLSPQSLNHLRSAVFNMFERARDPKHRTWTTENPARWVKRRRIPRASQSSRCVLRRGEVLPTLASFPTPTRETPWRWLAATCVYAGLRPGEAFGLRKEDVDTRTWTLAVRHSWLAPLPKDGDARDVTIVSELRPLLEAAMKASPSEWVFVQADGTPYTPGVRFHLVDHLRQIDQQGVGRWEAATRPARAAVPALVVADHPPSRCIELGGQPAIAPGVFAQAVYQQHGAAHVGAAWPLGQLKRCAVGGIDRRHGGRV